MGRAFARPAYQGRRQFLSREAFADGAPQLSLRFPEPENGEPQKLLAVLNFDEGDPVEEFRQDSLLPERTKLFQTGYHSPERLP